MKKNILAIFIEPTPYILDIINAIDVRWSGQLEVFFLTENQTQNWNISLIEKYKIFPKNRLSKLIVFIRQILKNNYHQVHFAGWGSFTIILFIIIAKLKGLVVTVESDTPASPYTKFWKRIVKRIVYPRLFRWVDLFLTGGTRQTHYINSYAVPLKKIIPVQMTVDIERIQQYANRLSIQDRIKLRNNYDISMDEIVFLYVGRLEVYKGIKDLIQAFNKVKSNSARLLIVGEGSLVDFVSDSMKNNSKICYAGRRIGNELLDYYFAADTLILPSHTESWGLVINEAMAMELPVIVSDRVGCIDDLIDDRNTGLIFKAEHIDELTLAIEYIADNPTLRLQMAKNAIKKIANWTLENEAQKICQAWKQLKVI